MGWVTTLGSPPRVCERSKTVRRGVHPVDRADNIVMGWAATIGIRANLVRELSATCGSHTKWLRMGVPLESYSREFKPFDPLDHVMDNPARTLGLKGGECDDTHIFPISQWK